MTAVVVAAGPEMHCPLCGLVWQTESDTARLAPPVSADTVMVPEAPTSTVATETAPAPLLPGISRIPGSPLATRATMSGTGLLDPDNSNVLTPETTAAAGALAHANVSATSVGEKAPVGAKAMVKFCAAPTAILTGAFKAPAVGLVAWKLKFAGTVVAGAIVHPVPMDAPALMMVAEAVAVVPICTDRLDGRTAATSDVGAVTTATLKVAVTFCGALMLMLHKPEPEHAPDQPAKVEPDAALGDNATVVPELKAAEHVGAQLMPAGLLVTFPVPVPAVATVNVYDVIVGRRSGVNLAIKTSSPPP